MSNTNNTNNNTKNNDKEDNTTKDDKPFCDYGGYSGGLLRWNTMRKRSKYISRYKKKDNEMMRRILLTRINE